MSAQASATPILVGVGQYTDHLAAADFEALSPQALAARAASLALKDMQATDDVKIDLIAAVRTVADSIGSELSALAYPFGGPDNFPRAVASHVGINPDHALYSLACGDEPQLLVSEMCEKIANGEVETVLLCGAEAAATSRQAQRNGDSPDWRETIGGQCEDRGADIDDLLSPEMVAHGMALPLSVYPLFENLRRHLSGVAADDYARLMGALLAGYNRVAAANPLSTHPAKLTAEDIATETAANRMVAYPYTKAMVARDAVNQAAAVILTSEEAARRMGIAETKWVYLHGYAHAAEPAVHLRQNLADAPAMALAYQAALQRAGVKPDAIAHFDLYSCFPVAVFLAMDILGLSLDDKRPFTVTGGLPFFGGPGNNYSMHAIASMVEALRQDPGTFGLVGANGGYLSKHAVGVYSTTAPAVWQAHDSAALQAEIDALPQTPFTARPEGAAVLESFVLLPAPDGLQAVIFGRLDSNSNEGDAARFVAANHDQKAIADKMMAVDPIGARIQVAAGDGVNHFTFI